MEIKKTDIIIHPVRLRIMASLSGRLLTTQELADTMPSVPKSSLYRHLAKLLDAEMVEVAETRQVRGTEEKVYRLKQSPRLQPEDLVNITKEEHLQYFTNYTAALLQAFSEYLEHTEKVDMAADQAGYTEVAFYATPEEFTRFVNALNQALFPLMQNPPGENRTHHKLATITHPLRIKGNNNETSA
jgi:DNA-binding transcriptional ArsR family regulator